jgi:hypothetical protein
MRISTVFMYGVFQFSLTTRSITRMIQKSKEILVNNELEGMGKEMVAV